MQTRIRTIQKESHAEDFNKRKGRFANWNENISRAKIAPGAENQGFEINCDGLKDAHSRERARLEGKTNARTQRDTNSSRR